MVIVPLIMSVVESVLSPPVWNVWFANPNWIAVPCTTLTTQSTVKQSLQVMLLEERLYVVEVKAEWKLQ